MHPLLRLEARNLERDRRFVKRTNESMDAMMVFVRAGLSGTFPSSKAISRQVSFRPSSRNSYPQPPRTSRQIPIIRPINC